MANGGSRSSAALKVVLVFAVLTALTVYLVWPTKLPAPLERNRIWHPEGYSLIAPADWEPVIEVECRDPIAKDRLGLRPKSQGKWQPRLIVTRLKKPPDLQVLTSQKEYREGTFQSQASVYFAGPEKKFWLFKIVCQRGVEWFELDAAVPEYEDIPHSSWWPYLESFQYDPARAIAPLKIPSPLPTSLPAHFQLSPPAVTQPNH